MLRFMNKLVNEVSYKSLPNTKIDVWPKVIRFFEVLIQSIVGNDVTKEKTPFA